MVSSNSGLDTRGRAGPAPRTPTSPLKVEVKPATGAYPAAAEKPFLLGQDSNSGPHPGPVVFS